MEKRKGNMKKKRKLRLWVRLLLNMIQGLVLAILLLSPIIYVIFFGYPI